MNTEPLRIEAGAGVLRDFRVQDVADVLAIIGDDRVTQWLSFDSRDHAGAVQMIKSATTTAAMSPRSEYYLAITGAHTGTDRVIGFARLALGAHRSAKLGYAINADEWGHGYATDAAEALVDFGVVTLGCHRITAAVGPDNDASLAVLRKLGFTLEGRLRDHVFTNGTWRDSLLYSILASESAGKPRLR